MNWSGPSPENFPIRYIDDKGLSKFSDFKNFIKTLLNRDYSRPEFDQWLNNFKDFVGRWLSEIIMLGCYSILSQEEHKKDFKIWVDEKHFHNKDAIFAANWIIQAHRNG